MVRILLDTIRGFRAITQIKPLFIPSFEGIFFALKLINKPINKTK